MQKKKHKRTRHIYSIHANQLFEVKSLIEKQKKVLCEKSFMIFITWKYLSQNETLFQIEKSRKHL